MDSYSLVIFDQHAVHERIKLEELYLNNYDSKSGCILSEKLIEPFKVSIKLIKENEFEKFCLSMKKIGFSISFLCAESTEIQVNIDRIPTILVKKFKTNQQSCSIILNKLIENQLHVKFYLIYFGDSQ
jgi:DNA mismatch repair ATPase MutL